MDTTRIKQALHKAAEEARMRASLFENIKLAIEELESSNAAIVEVAQQLNRIGFCVIEKETLEIVANHIKNAESQGEFSGKSTEDTDSILCALDRSLNCTHQTRTQCKAF